MTVAEILKAAAVKDTVLKAVQVDGLALLKIMQHCDGASPNIVTGQLLGLDVGQTMEVTDCYPFPVSARRACRLRCAARHRRQLVRARAGAPGALRR
jgi:hypothetical protein